MRWISIGDIHGCPRTLEKLVDALDPEADEHLVFLGDYIDRGPDSCAVIDYCLELQSRHDCTFLRGNHETYVIDFLYGKLASEEWSHYGGEQTLRSYGYGREKKGIIPRQHQRFFQTTKLYLDTDDYFFVHGGILPHITIAENIATVNDAVYLWQRPPRRGQPVAWEKTVVFGHTPSPKPIRRNRMIGVDTGCVFTSRPHHGYLTAVRLPSEEYVSVKNCDIPSIIH